MPIEMIAGKPLSLSELMFAVGDILENPDSFEKQSVLEAMARLLKALEEATKPRLVNECRCCGHPRNLGGMVICDDCARAMETLRRYTAGDAGILNTIRIARGAEAKLAGEEYLVLLEAGASQDPRLERYLKDNGVLLEELFGRKSIASA